MSGVKGLLADITLIVGVYAIKIYGGQLVPLAAFSALFPVGGFVSASMEGERSTRVTLTSHVTTALTLTLSPT